MKSIFSHVKRSTILGFLAVTPFALTFFALHLIYTSVDQRAATILERIVGFSFPGLGVFLVLVSLYLLGVFTSNLVGRQALGLIEKATSRIPLIRTTYQVGKQLADTLSLPQRQIFKRAVLVELLRPKMWATGFVTGSVTDRSSGEEFLKVYVPTPPNPASGTMFIMKESDTRDPGWTVEEALKAVVSGGIIGPDEIR